VFVPSPRNSETKTTALPDLKYWSLKATQNIPLNSEVVVLIPRGVLWKMLLTYAHINFYNFLSSGHSLKKLDTSRRYTDIVADAFYTSGPTGDLPIKVVPCYSYISKDKKIRWFKTSPLPFFLPRTTYNEKHIWSAPKN
jgi:hypothetical protein